jgi:hypothetical protein
MIVELHSDNIFDRNVNPINRMGDIDAEDSPEDDHLDRGRMHTWRVLVLHAHNEKCTGSPEHSKTVPTKCC